MKEKTFSQYRKQIYASVNGTKGNMVKLSKSSLLTKNEKVALDKVISALEEFRVVIFKERWKQTIFDPIILPQEETIKFSQEEINKLLKMQTINKDYHGE